MTDIREQEMQGKIDELTAQKASLEAENKQLRKQVEWLRKAQFGRKSETKKVVYPEEQMSLFNEAQKQKRNPALRNRKFRSSRTNARKRSAIVKNYWPNCLIGKLSSNRKRRSARNVAAHFRR